MFKYHVQQNKQYSERQILFVFSHTESWFKYTHLNIIYKYYVYHIKLEVGLFGGKRSIKRKKVGTTDVESRFVCIHV